MARHGREGRDWQGLLRRLRRYFGRFGDRTTRELRDDLAQDSGLLLWQWWSRVAHVRRPEAAALTIARRHRVRVLRARRRQSWLQFVELGVHGVGEPQVREPDEPALSIAGRSVPLAWARRQLPTVLARLSALDRQLLLGFHEGFCCAELAGRHARSEACVKTRLHRARRRVRREFERLVRVSGGLGETVLEE